MTILAHITGVPHHSEEVQSIFALWPLVLLAVQLIWVIAKQRTRQVVTIVLQGIRENRSLFIAVALVWSACAVVATAHATPAPIVLRNASAQVLGTIETTSSGVQELRNARRQLLGSYDPRTNQTRDAAGRFIGTGNLLTTLLK